MPFEVDRQSNEIRVRLLKKEIHSIPLDPDGSVGRADGRSDLGDPRRAAIAHNFSLNKRAGSVPVTDTSF
jgi:hypothetical protein